MYFFILLTTSRQIKMSSVIPTVPTTEPTVPTTEPITEPTITTTITTTVSCSACSCSSSSSVMTSGSVSCSCPCSSYPQVMVITNSYPKRQLQNNQRALIHHNNMKNQRYGNKNVKLTAGPNNNVVLQKSDGKKKLGCGYGGYGYGGYGGYGLYDGYGLYGGYGLYDGYGGYY